MLANVLRPDRHPLTPRALALCVAVAVAALAAGCGSSGSDDPAGGSGSSGGSGASGGGGPSGATGGSGASGATGGGATDPDRMNVGFVTLASDAVPAGTRANATFLPGGSAFRCEETAYGACKYFECAPRGGAAPASPAANPGAIEVAGGASALSFRPGADGTYETIVRRTALWSAAGGEALSISATGGTIAAFSGSLTAPAAATMTAPEPDADEWRLPRTAAVKFDWTGAGTSRVNVEIGSLESEDPIGVECDFAGSAGTGTVPAEALARLPAGMGYYTATVRALTHVAAGAWDVTLRADSSAMSPAGTAFTGSALIE